MTRNMAASVRQRLRNLARERGEDFQYILVRYGLERLLYRISRSEARERFVLKGAALFSVWTELPHRATRDIDFLGRVQPRGQTTSPGLEEVCAFLKSFLMPPLHARREGDSFRAIWSPIGPWKRTG